MSQEKPNDKPEKAIKMKKPSPKTAKLQADYDAAVADLQRIRADFENYRKRSEVERQSAFQNGQKASILKLLPVVDVIDRAVNHIPADLADNAWAQGVAQVAKKLESPLKALNLEKIDSAPGTVFNPELHEAIQFDEDSQGDQEVIAEELQAGYLQSGVPIRHAMVRVTRK